MDGQEWIQACFHVKGRVQGVGFRWWTRTTAEELGVGGTVENRRDGSVVVHATAPAGTLDAFQVRLEKGPWGSRVDSVERLASDRHLPRERLDILL